jgi:glycosyltransferase involved in cell wall biosynthesis
MDDTIAVLLKGYPRLSETFIAQEIRALEERGLKLRLYSMRHPTDTKRHPIHSEIEAPVTYLPEYLYQEPRRVLRAWWKLRKTAFYGKAVRVWWRDLKRDRTPNRVRRFGQALVMVAELPEGVRHIYAHFLHTPASVARYAAILSLRPWSVSAHAKDIWTSPDWEKQEKLADCDWAVTCTAVGAAHLAEQAVLGGVSSQRVGLVYHGLDLRRFPTAPPRGLADGSDPNKPVRLLSVCRAVEKKGLDDLLAALARLPADLAWTLEHIGGGPLLPTLRAAADRLGVSDRITWLGAMAQTEVVEAYGRADIFVLPSKIAGDGDRDGLPNVLMEAATQGVPLLATNVSAIPEFIHDGNTGRLTAPGDAAALAEALMEMIQKPEWRLALGRAGEVRVREIFDFGEGCDQVATLLGVPSPTKAVA